MTPRALPASKGNEGRLVKGRSLLLPALALTAAAALAQSPPHAGKVGIVNIQGVLAGTKEGQSAVANQDRQQALVQLGHRVMAVIEKYAREKGFTLILDSSPPLTPVLYASDTIDITSAIIKSCDTDVPSSAPVRSGPSAPAPASTPVAAQRRMRTPDGHPDFEGIWTNATMTLLERPVGLPWVFTEEEAAKFETAVIKDRSNDRRDGPPEVDVGRAYNDLFFDQGTTLARIGGEVRTSLILDPPDGHIPAYTLEARRRLQARAADAQDHPADRAQDRTLAERCLLWSAVPPMLPSPYNSTYQIVQTPGYLMILMEMMHDVRIIPLDGSSHLPSNVRLWMGDSRGHWEGDTLVVDTTNFTDGTPFYGSSENLHVVERFTRADANMILYRFTIDDPATFVRPWTGELPFVATPGPIYEYACHEGNAALRNILLGARHEEEQAEERGKK